MTFVCYMTLEQSPLIQADTLLTRKRILDQSSPIALNYPGITKPYLEGEDFPSSLCQKIEIVSPHRVFSWAGSTTQATAVIAEIKRREALDGKSMVDFISSLPSSEFDDLSCMLVELKGSNGYHSMYSGTTLPLGECGEVSVIGSGSGSFYGLLSHVESESPKSMQFENDMNPRTSDLVLRPRHIDASYHHHVLGGFGQEKATGGFIQTLYWKNGFPRFLENDLLVLIIADRSGKIASPLFLQREYRRGFYVIKQFNSVEERATMYRIPTLSNIAQFEAREISDKDIFNLNRIDSAMFMVTMMDSNLGRTIFIPMKQLWGLIQIAGDPIGFSLVREPVVQMLKKQMPECFD